MLTHKMLADIALRYDTALSRAMLRALHVQAKDYRRRQRRRRHERRAHAFRYKHMRDCFMNRPLAHILLKRDRTS